MPTASFTRSLVSRHTEICLKRTRPHFLQRLQSKSFGAAAVSTSAEISALSVLDGCHVVEQGRTYSLSVVSIAQLA